MIKKIQILLGLLVLGVLVTYVVGEVSVADNTTPGTVNDPLVTKSYVDGQVGALKAALEDQQNTSTPGSTGIDMTDLYAYIDGKLAEESATLFTVIGPLSNGQQVICGASAEVILRAGGGQVIAGANGDGLADLTQGNDLRASAIIPLQHHLLVSRDDGRGVLVTKDQTYILIKGGYTIYE